MICGIDYGSKLAGTTVLARERDGEIFLSQSVKGKDADLFILELILEEKIQLVALDAPLSLPGKLIGIPGKTDYFYRDCDKAVKAMSPMFIGGLTARAMKLKDELQANGVRVIEAYPKAIASGLGYYANYQKKDLSALPVFLNDLQKQFAHIVFKSVSNWHQLDACLAWLIAWKFQNATHSETGDEIEGKIYF
ncbi:MAG: hypothetical protein WBA74_23960 [Cyclobacteriaceae bacterium]